MEFSNAYAEKAKPLESCAF